MVRPLAVVVAVLLSIPAAVSAQSASPSKSNTSSPLAPGEIVAGIKGGLNVSNITEDGFTSRNGLVLGGYARRGVNEQFALQAEALLSQQGASINDITLKFTYLQVPVLGVMTFSGNSAKPFIYGGPSIGLKLSSKGEEDGDSFDLSASGTDLSLVLGAGLDFTKFSVDARYMMGLKDVDSTGDVAKHRVFSIMVGYRLK
jgi:hypothetical protein